MLVSTDPLFHNEGFPLTPKVFVPVVEAKQLVHDFWRNDQPDRDIVEGKPKVSLDLNSPGSFPDQQPGVGMQLGYDRESRASIER
jgi:hypothetical protein